MSPARKKTNIPPLPDLVTVGDFAALWGLTNPRIYQLIADGKLPPSEDGVLPLRQALRSMADHVRGGDLDGELAAEKLAKLKADRRLAEAEAGKADGSLVEVRQVEIIWSGVAAALKARLLSIPSRTATQLAAAASAKDGDLTPSEAHDMVKAEIMTALAELSAIEGDGTGANGSGKKRIRRPKTVQRRASPEDDA